MRLRLTPTKGQTTAGVHGAPGTRGAMSRLTTQPARKWSYGNFECPQPPTTLREHISRRQAADRSEVDPPPWPILPQRSTPAEGPSSRGMLRVEAGRRRAGSDAAVGLQPSCTRAGHPAVLS